MLAMTKARISAARSVIDQDSGTQDSGSDLFPDDDARYAAIGARDARGDGCFWYAVTTTGVYCRPSCGARLAKRGNVRFYTSRAEAEADGFRACKRCRPDQLSDRARLAGLVAAACRSIEAAEAPPTLEALAQHAGLSPFHFHRVFKAQTGVTPRQYAQALRRGRMQAALADGATVTDAIYAAGFGSSSRFYEKAEATLGMSAGRYKAGGRGETITWAIGPCSLGLVLVAATAKGLCSIAFGDARASLVDELKQRFPAAQLAPAEDSFAATVAHVVAHVDRPQETLGLPLDLRGTAFQQKVWAALQQIPAGTTATYTAVAAAIGKPAAVRAVAAACAANPCAVAVPCHRVVRQDGDLAGYRWGVARKRKLLDVEGQWA